MGPDTTTMSATSTIKLIKLMKLADDGTNWITYRERVLNMLTHKGLCRHIMGTAQKPEEVEEQDGKFYKKGSLNALTDTELEALEKSMDEYEQKQASVREIIYKTISQSMFLQIKNEPTAAKVWAKVVSIMEDKGDLIQVSVLMKLQTMICLEDEDVRAHLAKMTELKEQLEGMGAPVSNQSFAAMIRKSLPPSYRSLLQTLSATARVNNKILTSSQIIAAIHEEADEAKVQKEADKAAENAAMIAAHVKKEQEKRRKKCANCKRTGHTKEECYRPGGGKEGQGPRDKKKQATSANVASSEIGDNNEDDEDLSLAVTCIPDETLEAMAALPRTHTAIIDCGATRHFTPDRSALLNFTQITPRPIKAANGPILQAVGGGDLKVLLPMSGSHKPTRVTLREVYYSPEFAFTLVSVGTMNRKGYKVNFEDGKCTISTPKPERRVIGDIPEVNGLYRISLAEYTSHVVEEALAATNRITISELHRKMGHINHDDLRHMVQNGTVTGIDLDMDSKPEPCPTCIEAKATRRPFPKLSTSDRAKSYGDKVVSDLWGPAPTATIKGKKYYLAFQDQFTHEERIYFLHKKSEAFSYYKIYEAWVKMQREANIKTLGTDRGGEFTGATFKSHLENSGTVRHLTVHDSPQSNGKAERANRTIVEGARAMLLASKLPEYLWAEAASHHVWLRNRTPTKTLPKSKTPLEMATGTCPDLSNIHEWGSRVWVKRTHSSKLASKVNTGRFIGFDEESKGYRIYWDEKRTVTVERDVYFDKKSALEPETTLIEGENDAPSNQHRNFPTQHTPTKKDKSSAVQHNVRESDTRQSQRTPERRNRANSDQNPSTIGRDMVHTNSPTPQPTPSTSSQPPEVPGHDEASDDVESEIEQPLGCGKRARKPPGFYSDLMKGKRPAGGDSAAVAENELELEILGDFLDEEDLLFAGIMEMADIDYALGTGGEPHTLKEALSGEDANKWKTAVQAELDQIEKLGTWKIVEAPQGANIVSSKYVFKHKRDEKGNIIKYKARLVARGFTQKFGVDYFNTRVWIVRWETLRNLLVQAASRGSVMHQADVKNAYLNADIHEDIYVSLPPEYHQFRPLPLHAANRKLVCELIKGLYGTKQAGHAWYMKLRETFLELGYRVSDSDLGVFYRFQSRDKYTIVAVATDDLSIISESTKSAELIKKQLNQHFELVDLGELKWLLGVHITRNLANRTISLGQQSYIDEIVKHFELEDAHTTTTPMEHGIDLTPGNPHVSPAKISHAEFLNYRAVVGALLYCSTVTRPDIAFAVGTLSRYLDEPSKTHWTVAQRVIRYLKGTRNHCLVLGGSKPQLLAYSDADWASQLHRHSISRFTIFHGCGPVSWSSKKQPIIALSSTEAEYVALSHVVKDILWHRKLHLEFLFFFSPIDSPISLLCDNQGAITLSKNSVFHMRTKHIDTRFHFVRFHVNHSILSISYCPTDEMIADIFTKPLARFKFEHFRSLLNLHTRSA